MGSSAADRPSSSARRGAGRVFERVELAVGLASDDAVRWRSLGALFLVGGVLALLAAISPSTSFDQQAVVIGLAVTAIAAGAAIWSWATRLSVRLMSPVLGFGTALITVAVLASGQPDGGFSLLYVWVALQAFYFLTPRSATVHLGGIALTYAAALVALHGGAHQWLMVVGTAAMTGWLVAALRARIDRLAVHARRDPLTGLPNRRAFDESLERALTASTTDGQRLAVALVDLDRFKRLNDRLGHQTGDEALQRFATVASRACPNAEIARFGGDEFAVIVRELHDAPARGLGASLRAAIASDPRLRMLGVTASVGTASFPAHGGTSKTLLHAADRALYRAKDAGGDRCVGFSPALLTDARPAERATSAHLQPILLLAETIDLRDVRTAQHSQGVAAYAHSIAEELGLPPERREQVRLAGIVHDLGKIGVPDAVLLKPGKLDDEEWAQIQRHPEIGAQILAQAGLHDLAVWVSGHHERPDGRGYPLGLTLEEIPLEARILAVADAYEAMLAHRPYREPMSQEAARAELRKHRGTQFDEVVVDAFLVALADEPVTLLAA